MRAASDRGITARMWFITACITLWALRLSIYIFIRHKKEDYRYKEMREDWTKQGVCVYYAKAFGFIYGMQGLFSIINNGSVLFVNIWSEAWVYDIKNPAAGMHLDNRIYILDIIGAVIFMLGFMIEVCSDRQLANHLANPKPGTGKFIKSGLWRYSRHPNYFGEAVIWWGIFLIAINVQYGWATFFAPLFINILLRFVSGVPFPEKKYKTNPEWMQYCRETNVFCLWFYKNVSIEDQFA
jgi:steroid 5-alpha reductase family enzyme